MICRWNRGSLTGTIGQGAVDLLGILAYGALAAFERLAEDARAAPTLSDKVHGATMAALQIAHFERVRDRLAELDSDVLDAMQPFHEAVQRLPRAHQAQGLAGGPGLDLRR